MYVCIGGGGGEGGGCLPPLPTSPIPLIGDVSIWPKFRLHNPSRGRKKRQDQMKMVENVQIFLQKFAKWRPVWYRVCSWWSVKKDKCHEKNFLMTLLVKNVLFSIRYKQKNLNKSANFLWWDEQDFFQASRRILPRAGKTDRNGLQRERVVEASTTWRDPYRFFCYSP